MHLPPTAGSTADEVLAIALGKLAPRADDIFADIGCGTGKVSLAASPLAREVWAVDRRPEALAWAREQARAAGATNVQFIEGEAPEALAHLPVPDCAFIGGSGNLAAVIGALAAKGTGRMVVSCVRIETLGTAVGVMRELGIFREALLVQVSRSKDLAGGTMFVPANPAYLVFGGA
ncbi:MAG TPA: methyltransferase domain-containing protein [Methanomicrobiales archaeon]|jgi:cobalt-precorrin-6B (C15)-methyltransferase|nr:methyltransferase domain-containing protein [Methanomicrobiales archaeon]